MVPDNDVSSLFEKNSIKEIEEILTKTRSDIEKKKEDLRVMVGERYRDLIEAADTISDMQKSARAICCNIESMESLCISLRERGLIGFKTRNLSAINFDEPDQSSLHYKYSVAIQVKVLVDAPEILWALVEKKEFLSATQLLLLSEQVHTALNLSPNASSIMSSFPVISQQWSTISQFKSVIIKGCTSLIQCDVVNYKNVENALVSLILLKGGGFQNAMKTYLNLRKVELESILIAKSVKMTKTQLVQFIENFISACDILYKIFVGNDSNSCNLERCLNRVCGKSDSENGKPMTLPLNLLEVSSSQKFMPKVIAEFRPSLPEDCTIMDLECIQGQVWEWMDAIVLHGAENITKLLTCITSIKSLSMIRICITESHNTCIDKERWKEITESLLGDKVFNPCNKTIFEPIAKRAKEIVSNELEKTSSYFVRTLTDLIKEMIKNPKVCQEEGDIASFIWSESASDVLVDDHRDSFRLKNAQSNLKGIKEKSGLFYKSHGYTKRIQALCKVLDSKLQALLEDVLNYQPEEYIEGSSSPSWYQEISSQEDYMDILEYLEKNSLEHFQKTLLKLKDLSEGYSYLKNVEEEFTEDETMKCLSIYTCIQLLISRLCNALPTVCTQLKICCVSSQLANADSARRIYLGISIETVAWSEFKKSAYNISGTLMSDILIHLASNVKRKLNSSLIEVINCGTPEDITSMFPSWERVAIKEENDSGEILESVILIPLHLSPQVSDSLMDLCSSINCIGAHTISRSSHSCMVTEVCMGVISSYECLNIDKLDELLASEQQTISLQLIFDLRLVHTMLLPRENKELSSRCLDMIDKLDKRVDPFDYDVFMPHVTSRVKMAAQRLQILFGSLLPLDRKHVKSVPHQPHISSSINNCLMFTPALEIPRFSNVPIPSSSSNYSSALADSLSMTLSNSLQLANPGESGLSISIDDNASKASITSLTTARSASSLFSAMSSSWFGGGGT